MCGIVGLIAPPDRRPDRASVERGVRCLAHRGPDARGLFSEGRAALGHTRLSIVDVSGGDQPMAGEDASVTVVFNGEIWNHEALREELESGGHTFRTRSDTEVLVHGYEEWGEGLLERIDGMFAFAVWDARRERLLLARDRMGKKPLYVAEGPWGLAFGSSLRSVAVSADLTPSLDARAVSQFLFQRYVCAPLTMLDGVTKLAPGELASFEGGRLERRRYWRVEPGPDRRLGEGELRGLLRDSVARRLMGDVPVGVLLSGGVDSAAVLGLMREAGAGEVPSFTIGFDDPLYDERPLAREVAARHGSEHHELRVGSEDFLDALPRLSWLRGEPLAEASEIPLLLLAELTSRHVKVVLTGDGGDELFGGYPKYRAERLIGLGGVPARRLLRAAVTRRSRGRSHQMLERASETLGIADRELRWASWFRSFSSAELGCLLSPPMRPAVGDLTAPLRSVLAGYSDLPARRRQLIADTLTWLPENMLLRGDNVLMAASVEGRTPMLDRRIVERVAGAPDSAASLRRPPKAALRDAVSDLVPAAVTGRAKRGFAVPIAQFLLEDPKRRLERMLLSDRCLDRGIFERDEIRALIAGEGSYGVGRELKLFTAASLELWMRSCFDDIAATEAPGPDSVFEEVAS